MDDKSHLKEAWSGSHEPFLPARRYAGAVLAVIVCPSVHPYVTSRCSTKTAKPSIMQTTPHDSPGTLSIPMPKISA